VNGEADLIKPLALVVDDEPLIRMDTADILSDAGFEVLEAGDATEAVACLEQYSALRVLLTDIQMPEIDGLTLARHVRAHWPHIGIIIASGALRPEIVELPENARFLSKPLSTKLILAALEEVCQLK
jgi:CheY-like chemotaxis protein